MKPQLFFSIIVPAHNEQEYVAQTLEHLRDLNYPKEKYEVIVVENASTDKTFELAKQFESVNLKVLQSTKGVSKAKNLGIDHLASASDWVIFVDADTILEKEFLNELEAYLSRPNNFTVGTTTVKPLPPTLNAKLWFSFYDMCHRLFKVSYSIKLVKRSLFLPTQAAAPLRFDEALTTSEDLDMIKQALKHGKFFFLPTKQVYTSTRRFEKEGWWTLFFRWTFEANLPKSWRKKITYEVVR